MVSEAACSSVVSSAASRLFVYSIIQLWSVGDLFPIEEVTVNGIPEKKVVFVLLVLTVLWVLSYPLVQVRHPVLNFSLLL